VYRVLRLSQTGLTWIKADRRLPSKMVGAVIDQEEQSMSRIGMALLLALLGLAQPAGAADAGRGRALYESRCTGCHTKSVHQRDSRKATSFEGILAQVARWNATLGGDWRAEDIEDVAVYLNERYYKYACPASFCPPGRASVAPSGTVAAR
jgi:hypothetical protein